VAGKDRFYKPLIALVHDLHPRQVRPAIRRL
jgi:hypothetical protein